MACANAASPAGSVASSFGTFPKKDLTKDARVLIIAGYCPDYPGAGKPDGVYTVRYAVCVA